MGNLDRTEADFRDALEFNRAHKLLFEISPDDSGVGLFRPLPEATARRWRSEGVHTVFAFTESSKDPRVQSAKRAGFAVQPVDIRRVRNDDFAFLRELSNRLHAELKTNAAAFYFSPADTADVLSCAAVFLVALGASPDLAAPEGAIQYVFGRDHLSGEDLRVFRFKEAIDQGYSMPAAVRRHFQLPTPTADLAPGLHVAGTTQAPDAAPAGTDDLIEELPALQTEHPESDTNASPVAVAEPVGVPPASAPSPTPLQSVPPSAPAQKSPVSTPPVPVQSDGGAESRFRASPFLTIRNKLLMIISMVVLSALGVMIYLASYFYREDSQAKITEYALKTTTLIGQKVEGEFTNLTYTALNTGAGLLSRKNAAERDLFTDLFFQNNQSFAFLSVMRSDGGTLQPVETVVNGRFLKEAQVSREKLAAVVQANGAVFAAAVASPVVRNVSPGLPVPMLALAASFGEAGQRFVVVSLLDPARFQESFKSTGIIKTFMVDGAGVLMAHPDSKLVLSADNQSRSELVKKMLQSKLGNGQIVYRNPDGQSHLGFFQKLTFASLGVVASVSEAEAFAAVREMQNRNLMIAVVVLFTAILIVFFFSRTLSVPIVRLVSATHRVESGDYAIQISPTTRDEIGSLTSSFSSMTGGLAERERLKESMTRFVNKQVAEKAARGELALGGEEKDCAIFFSDLRGFTAMSEKMTPEQVVEYLNEYFTDMVGCVSETHGVVDKYIGDAIMATWGALESVGNNTENAVNAALMMREKLMEFNARGGDRPFAKFGCGINSGPVVSGQIGSSQKMEYTVIGDAVNLASRVETLNKPFGTDILISEDSYNRVAEIFNVEKMPPITVKGKTEPQIIFAVLGRRDDPNCPKDMNAVRARTGGDPPKVDLANFAESKEDKFEILAG